MSDDETRPIEPDAPVPPPAPTPAAEAPAPEAGQAPPTYAVPAGYPAYAAAQRPRFADQVMGMRAVVAVALACLIIGGLSGWILGHAAGSDGDRFGPGMMMQRGGFPEGGPQGFQNGPNGFPNGPGGFSNRFPSQQPGQQPSPPSQSNR